MSILWARNSFSRLKAENLALNPKRIDLFVGVAGAGRAVFMGVIFGESRPGRLQQIS
jgi:ABC-type uncharacterized transport system ATPase subunit